MAEINSTNKASNVHWKLSTNQTSNVHWMMNNTKWIGKRKDELAMCEIGEVWQVACAAGWSCEGCISSAALPEPVALL
jgi:hypothetical protein